MKGFSIRSLWASGCLVTVLAGLLVGGKVEAAAPVLKWSRSISGVVRESSPVVSSGYVVVGAHDGTLYRLKVLDGNNATGWPQQTGYPINATPSIADFGQGEIVYIGSGDSQQQCSGGSLSGYRVDGTRLFSVELSDNAIGQLPSCASPAVHSSAALGDTNNDNTMDIHVGTLGLKAWSLTANGSVNTGWPYYWDDTQFATPALADLDGDTITDTIRAGDSSPGAPIDHRGGIVKALKGNGLVMWEYRTNEIVRSSPVVGDVDGDGDDEVVFGTGNYWVSQPGGASDATKIFVLDAKTGHLKWSKDLGAQTLASPALADVDADGIREIIIGTWQGAAPGKVWIVDGLGAVRSGYPRDSGGGIIIGQISTADLNNDGAQDILVPTGGGVFAYDGTNGTLLWALRQGQVSYQNSPFIGDLDNNGKLDIVIAGGKTDGTGIIDRYEFANSTDATLGNNAWSMFHGDIRLTGNVVTPPLTQDIYVPPGAAGEGYLLATETGKVATFGSTPNNNGIIGGIEKPVVGAAATPGSNGYWLVASDGGIFSFGDAQFYGSTGNINLNKPIVGMAPTASGNGYWLVASDGGIFSFGDAQFYGSTGNINLVRPIVGMRTTASGNGYWLVASDGGIFSFGDAQFYGSTGNINLNKPIVGMAPTASGNGYWLVASDGGIFSFGDAPFRGSTGSISLNKPIVSMMRSPSNGYWLVASDGGIFSFGDAQFYGSAIGLGNVVASSVQGYAH